MNTVTAYAARAKAARDEARRIVKTSAPAPFTSAQDERVARLADYAFRCDELANLADGARDTKAFRQAGEYADETHSIWKFIRWNRVALRQRAIRESRAA